LISHYKTIELPAEALLTEKQSKFHAYAYPANNESSIKLALETIKNLHPKATHHCYAYRLGLDKNNYRVNDDGEPSGTAGRPILGQIDSAKLCNVLIIVVRYYGGTKLGVSGLIKAYKNAAQQAIENAAIVNKEVEQEVIIECNYTEVNDLLNFLKSIEVNTWNDHYTDKCEISIKTGISTVNKLISWLENRNFTYSVNHTL
jgi:uncharacterized YigZ family protein